MVIADFSSKVIFLDTAPLIYFIEGHSDFQPILAKLFAANDNGNFIFYTTSITLLEVLVKPLRDGQIQLVSQYKSILLRAPGIEIYDIDNGIAERAAELTNDSRLRSVPEIQSVTLSELQ